MSDLVRALEWWENNQDVELDRRELRRLCGVFADSARRCRALHIEDSWPVCDNCGGDGLEHDWCRPAEGRHGSACRPCSSCSGEYAEAASRIANLTSPETIEKAAEAIAVLTEQSGQGATLTTHKIAEAVLRSVEEDDDV